MIKSNADVETIYEEKDNMYDGGDDDEHIGADKTPVSKMSNASHRDSKGIMAYALSKINVFPDSNLHTNHNSQDYHRNANSPSPPLNSGQTPNSVEGDGLETVAVPEIDEMDLGNV